jgi:3-hydroxybutyryl-CoA dehydrogenase
MNINTICVCGAGTMGSGIAQAVAQAGFFTLLYELNPVVLANAKSGIEKNLEALVTKGKIPVEEKEKIFRRIQFTEDLQNCWPTCLLRPIVEKPGLKIALFNQLARSITVNLFLQVILLPCRLQKLPIKPGTRKRLIGMHFFNPATIMKLVEVVTTRYTNTATVNIVKHLAKQMGKTTVLCKDSPGFIVNAVARPYYLESLLVLEEMDADLTQIDRLMEATGFKMGPFRLMDLIGNDVNYAVSCSLYEQLDKPARLRPSPIQEKKVKEAKLGKKNRGRVLPLQLTV